MPLPRSTLGVILAAVYLVAVLSVAEGPFWTWSAGEWGHYGLMAILFTPVLAWPSRR